MKLAHPLLDEVISRNHLRNDSHLADEIGYSKGRVCEIRNKHCEVNDDFRCAIARRFNMTLKQIDALAPPIPRKIKEK